MANSPTTTTMVAEVRLALWLVVVVREEEKGEREGHAVLGRKRSRKKEEKGVVAYGGSPKDGRCARWLGGRGRKDAVGSREEEGKNKEGK